MEKAPWTVFEADGPIIGVAVHNGHSLRRGLKKQMLISSEDRLREEDPKTGIWAATADSYVVVNRSRFEVDLNRPSEMAVYASPQDCWGLTVWEKHGLTMKVFEQSMALYDAFYDSLWRLVSSTVKRWGKVIVLDIHSYNHRRNGPRAQIANPNKNPDINLGTKWIDRKYWLPIIDRFLDVMGNEWVAGDCLDTRENVRFSGGHLVRWLNKKFPHKVCPLAVEVKKFYMDEWTGSIYNDVTMELQRSFARLTHELKDVLRGM